MKHYNVQPEAWAPLGGGRHKPYENEMLERIADAHQKTIAQVVLRWNVQRGVTVILNPLDRNVLKRTLPSGISH